MQRLVTSDDRIAFSHSYPINLTVESSFFHYLSCRSAWRWVALCQRWRIFAFVFPWILSHLFDCQFASVKRRDSLLIREGTHDVFHRRLLLQFQMIIQLSPFAECSNSLSLFQCFLAFPLRTDKQMLLAVQLTQMSMSNIENQSMWNGLITNLVSRLFDMLYQIERWFLNHFKDKSPRKSIRLAEHTYWTQILLTNSTLLYAANFFQRLTTIDLPLCLQHQSSLF